MTKEQGARLRRNSVVQLAPGTGNPMFGGCMMVVTEPKAWGAQGFVQSLGVDGKMGGQAYYRANFEEMEYVGEAQWVPGPSPSESLEETEVPA